jgi:hypothetical protein
MVGLTAPKGVFGVARGRDDPLRRRGRILCKGRRRKEKDVTIAQRFAQVFGVIYLIVGIAGFIPIPPLLVGDLPPTVIGPFDGYLLGLFAVNWFHSLAHVVIGAAGLAVYRSPAGAMTYALALGVAYALLFIIGLVTPLPALGGLLPLNVLDDLLHLLTAALAFGAYFASRRAPGAARSRV